MIEELEEAAEKWWKEENGSDKDISNESRSAEIPIMTYTETSGERTKLHIGGFKRKRSEHEENSQKDYRHYSGYYGKVLKIIFHLARFLGVDPAKTFPETYRVVRESESFDERIVSGKEFKRRSKETREKIDKEEKKINEFVRKYLGETLEREVDFNIKIDYRSCIKGNGAFEEIRANPDKGYALIELAFLKEHNNEGKKLLEIFKKLAAWILQEDIEVVPSITELIAGRIRISAFYRKKVIEISRRYLNKTFAPVALAVLLHEISHGILYNSRKSKTDNFTEDLYINLNYYRKLCSYVPKLEKMVEEFPKLITWVYASYMEGSLSEVSVKVNIPEVLSNATHIGSTDIHEIKDFLAKFAFADVYSLATSGRHFYELFRYYRVYSFIRKELLHIAGRRIGYQEFEERAVRIMKEISKAKSIEKVKVLSKKLDRLFKDYFGESAPRLMFLDNEIKEWEYWSSSVISEKYGELEKRVTNLFVELFGGKKKRELMKGKVLDVRNEIKRRAGIPVSGIFEDSSYDDVNRLYILADSSRSTKKEVNGKSIMDYILESVEILKNSAEKAGLRVNTWFYSKGIGREPVHGDATNEGYALYKISGELKEGSLLVVISDGKPTDAPNAYKWMKKLVERGIKVVYVVWGERTVYTNALEELGVPVAPVRDIKKLPYAIEQALEEVV